MLDNMVVFNRTLAGFTIESLGQLLDKFNAASGGTIVLTATGWEGDFMERSFFQAIHSAQRRVDRYGSNDAVAATPLVQTQENAVKIAGGFGPILFEPSQFTWLMQSPAVAIRVIGQNMAEAMLADMLNTSLACAVAAIGAQAEAKTDVRALSPSQAVTLSNLNKMHAKFGDHSSSIRAHIMRGATFHKIIGQNIANANQLFVAGNVQIVDVLGRLVVVTDSPALYVDNSPTSDIEYVLGLVPGAITVHDVGDLITNLMTTNGKERIESTYQADYTWGLEIKGYSWDKTSGGKSPTDAELATAANWDKVYADIKHTAGVILVANAEVE